MRIEKYVFRQMDQNCYLLIDDDKSLAYIIDPGERHPDMEESIERQGLEIPYILLTHGHYDHIACGDYYRKKYGAKICCGQADEAMLEDKDLNLSVEFGDALTYRADIILSDGDNIGQTGIKAIACPGHTPGGVSYLIGKYLFTGDTLFRDSCGRWDLPGGNFRALAKSLARLFELDDDIEFFPGHGGSGNLGYEKKNNPLLPYIEKIMKREG